MVRAPHLVVILFVNGNRAWLTEVQSRPGLLPNQLRPELNLARSCDGRRLQRSIAWNVCSPTVDEGCDPGAKVGPVEQIESLSSELDLHFLAQQIVVFEERKIEAFQTGSTQRVAPEIAQRAERRK